MTIDQIRREYRKDTKRSRRWVFTRKAYKKSRFRRAAERYDKKVEQNRLKLISDSV